MQVDVSFSFAKVYNIEKFDVVLGQKFSIITDYGSPKSWFADNDPVLSITVNGKDADIEATAKGTSIIKFFDAEDQLLKKISITVVDAILEPAASLGITSEAPVPKTD